MSDFLDKLIGDGGDNPKRPRYTHCEVVDADDTPDLSKAISTIMFHVMNRGGKGGGGVREVGESCTIMLPQVEVTSVDKRTGKQVQLVVGDYTFRIERTA